MDILAHSLWTNVLYKAIPQTRGNKTITLWGIFFGVLPDLLSFAPFFVYGIYQSIFANQTFLAGPPSADTPLFKYALESYNYSHSFIVWLVLLAVVWAMIKKFPWALLGWALHILIDIFTHTEAFFATPFLFPISSFKVSVVSWAHPLFMILNYGALLILYLFVIPKWKRKIFDY